MSSKTNKESSRMSSIARSINMEFWLREFSHMLLLDMVIIGLAVFAFIMWREGLVPDGQTVASRYLLGTDSYETLKYVIETESGIKYAYMMHRILDPLKMPAIILGVVELAILIRNIFSTGLVRKKMQPLNEVAIRTEELSSMSAAGGGAPNLKSMEKAISTLDPEQPNAKVTTGDKELQSLEIAINNLLERIRESHRQQERFVSDASHELRTPIAVIQGYVNMLDRWGKDDPETRQEAIDAISAEAASMPPSRYTAANTDSVASARMEGRHRPPPASSPLPSRSSLPSPRLWATSYRLSSHTRAARIRVRSPSGKSGCLWYR